MEEYRYKIYTPQKYAIKMAEIALEKYFKIYGKTKESLEKVRIIDLACGSGNLLLPILTKLLDISKDILGQYIFLKEWITGYDIDKNALLVFQERVRITLLNYGLNGEVLLYNRDSLYDNIDKDYDIVIGNPPYLGEKNHKEIFQKIKDSEFGKKYYRAKMDYFYFFIAKGIDLLKKDGILVYLTTNYWLKADGAENIRKKIKDEGHFFKIENYDHSIFKSATGQHNIIFYWIKNLERENIIISENDINYEIDKDELFEDNKIILMSKGIKSDIEKIKNKGNYKLKDLLCINQGIVSGLDKAFVFKEYDDRFSNYLKPFYKNKDIMMYGVSEKIPYWILYLDETREIDEKIYNHLNKYRERLENRREVKSGVRKWWALQWYREEEIFLKPKIVARQRCKTNMFGYTEKEFYGSADIYYLTKKREDISLFYILGYLNSKVFNLWFSYIGKRKGKNLEFYSTPLKESPIYYPENRDEIIYIENLVKKQIIDYKEEIQKEIDRYFEKIFD